jgi:hypothetical protein
VTSDVFDLNDLVYQIITYDDAFVRYLIHELRKGIETYFKYCWSLVSN